jgi:hypothetical protein
MENSFSAAARTTSATLTLKVKVPSVAGVPLMTPFEDRFRPGGKGALPGARLHTKGNVPPVAARVWL